jgi:hypothetical protein
LAGNCVCAVFIGSILFFRLCLFRFSSLFVPFLSGFAFCLLSFAVFFCRVGSCVVCPLCLGVVCCVLGLGSWVLGLGSWALGLGPWALGLGSWVLGLGSWVLGLPPNPGPQALALAPYKKGVVGTVTLLFFLSSLRFTAFIVLSALSLVFPRRAHLVYRHRVRVRVRLKVRVRVRVRVSGSIISVCG